MMRLVRIALLCVIGCLPARAGDWVDDLCAAKAAGTSASSTRTLEAEQVVKLITGNAPVYASIHTAVVEGGDADAFAEHCTNGIKLLVFGTRFIERVRQSPKGTGPYWSWVFVAAHEVGHLWRNHGNLRMPCPKAGPRDAYCPCGADTPEEHKEFNRAQELEADFFAGYVLSKLGAKMDDALSAMHALDQHDSCTHPARTRRAEAVSRGWQQAKGQTALGYRRGSREDLAQFELIANRDIYGGDFREILGIDMETCAALCLKSPACAMFSFDRWNSACFLKSGEKIGHRFALEGFPATRRLAAGDLILKREPKSTVGIRREVMDALPGVDERGKVVTVRRRNRYFYDQPMSVARLPDWSACVSSCKADDGCVAFNFHDGSCERFAYTDGHYPSPGRSVGYFWSQDE